MVDITFNSSVIEPNESNDALKFNLYLKNREISEVASLLRNVGSMPPTQRKAWLKEHEETVSGLLDAFMEDASGVFDGLYLDDEAMDLSARFVTTVRDVMSTLQGMTGMRS